MPQIDASMTEDLGSRFRGTNESFFYRSSTNRP